jgi:hypothetical protein
MMKSLGKYVKKKKLEVNLEKTKMMEGRKTSEQTSSNTCGLGLKKAKWEVFGE